MERLHHPRGGFTLIELSIVLVIIGLIVGGVLVGRDLIRAAEVRAQISQIEKFQTATNTFYGKYGYLPGDIPPSQAALFGFMTRKGGPGQGDGNGFIEGYNAGSANSYAVLGEPMLFWTDLSSARMIEGSFTYSDADTANSFISPVSAAFPAAKLGPSGYNYVFAFSTTSGSQWNGWPPRANYFGIAAINSGTGYMADCCYNIPLWGTPGLTVKQAYMIDSKIDDGLPTSGRVMPFYINAQASWAANWPSYAASSTAATCFYGSGSTYQYSININDGAGNNCALSIQFQ